jgi:adenine phosphoribosyltransferase
MHKHIITKYTSPIIADDILATGGTVLAITDMLSEVGITPNSFFFLSEIVDLNAREKLEKIAPVLSLLK